MKLARSMYYKLDENRNVIPCSHFDWMLWYGVADRSVADTDVSDRVRVSTIFLGLDMGGHDGPPLVFETMVFVNGEPTRERRCATWQEAEAQHAAIIASVFP